MFAVSAETLILYQTALSDVSLMMQSMRGRASQCKVASYLGYEAFCFLTTCCSLRRR